MAIQFLVKHLNHLVLGKWYTNGQNMPLWHFLKEK